MTKKMLIDAAHPEEVRVALMSQGKIEDFDFESAAKKPLRGNIFLARVTRVEPSLQAAFVDYGGNRHGFLAFSEIHPDYYQIPVSDRELLQEAEKEVAELAAELELAQRGDDEDGDDVHAEEARGVVREIDVDGDDDIDRGDDIDSDDDADDEPSLLAAGDDEADDAPSDNETPDGDDSDDDDAAKEEEEEEEDVKKEAGDDGAAETDDKSAADASAAKDAPADDAPAADGSEDEQPAVELNADESDDAEAAAASDEAIAKVEAGDEISDEEGVEEEAPVEAKTSRPSKRKSAAAKAREARDQLFERYKDAKRKRSNLLRNYKIQEVIKRRQILLIQVVKEERGNKGAALTTYMSLAGRYCVLMPNTARGGGISRKIAHVSDRRRLRRVVDSLEVPQGMGLIIRTAGAKRTKVEIKRDYDYLLRLWENIRTLTLKSIAPCLVYEEANLIKRAIRDLYDKDISDVLVEGETGYREAKDFMKMLMPSHAKNVQPYKEAAPIFLRHGIETQLDGMYQPTVRLKSGGYIVIHQTEALVAIDVNSGRATRERNIEQTALKTNVEAATEAARQFRLRDLAGLIVIDFIDMEEGRNNRKVEKALKEAMKNDRARVQVGRISSFGLLELSRQRRRSGIVDGTTQTCPTCSGGGAIRSNEIAALRILRAIEGEAISGKVGRITLRASLDVSLHILNHNRDWVKRIEDNNGVVIEILADPDKAGDVHDLEKSGVPSERKVEKTFIRADQTEPVEVEEEEVEAAPESDAEEKRDSGRKRRRRRRGGRKDAGGDDRRENAEPENNADGDSDGGDQQEKAARDESEDGEDGEDGKPKKRRRGRRGGRRNRRSGGDEDRAAKSEDGDAPESGEAVIEAEIAGADVSRDDVSGDDAAIAEPAIEPSSGADEETAKTEERAPRKRTRRKRTKKAAAPEAAPDAVADNAGEAPAEPAETVEAVAKEPEAEASGGANGAEKNKDAAAKDSDDQPTAPEAEAESAPKKRAKKGWWQRAVS